ncbi:MAG: hypothetical protein AB1452_02960, partial [Pseudomonadota bacterium]
VCPAVGAASLGALGDGRRYAGASAGALWRGAFAVLALFAAASIAYPFVTPHAVSGWPMLAFALLGLLANAASVLAAFPERLSGRHPFSVRASSAGYAMLAGAGAAGLLRPEGWICVAAVLAAVPVLAAERLRGRRSKR